MNKARRTFLQLTFIAGMFPYARFLNAQTRNETTLAEITSNRASADQLREEINKLGMDIDDGAAEGFLFREAKLRVDLKAILDKVPSDSISAYVLEDQKQLADELQKEGIALLPPEHELRPVKLPVTPDKAGCDDSLVSVFSDIVIEWFGLQEFEGALKLAIDKTPALREQVDSLAKAADLRDWEQAVDLSLNVLNFLSKAEFLDQLAKAIGKKEATRLYRAVLAKLAGKFVPFIGQAYAGITLATAIFRNSGRLIQIVKCELG